MLDAVQAMPWCCESNRKEARSSFDFASKCSIGEIVYTLIQAGETRIQTANMQVSTKWCYSGDFCKVFTPSYRSGRLASLFQCTFLNSIVQLAATVNDWSSWAWHIALQHAKMAWRSIAKPLIRFNAKWKKSRRVYKKRVRKVHLFPKRFKSAN